MCLYTQGVILVLVSSSLIITDAITNNRSRHHEVPEQTINVFNKGPHSHSHVEQSFGRREVAKKYNRNPRPPSNGGGYYMQVNEATYPQPSFGPAIPGMQPPRSYNAPYLKPQTSYQPPYAPQSYPPIQGHYPEISAHYSYPTDYSVAPPQIAPPYVNGYPVAPPSPMYAPPPPPPPPSMSFYETDKARYMCLVLGICNAASPIQNQATNVNQKFRQQYVWSQLEFGYESEFVRQQDLNSGFWVPSVAAPIDVDVYYGKLPSDTKLFVTIPRFQPGSPVTLGYVTSKKISGNPVIQPFPSWEWHRNPEKCNSKRLVSVYRIKIDECGRIWVLDAGRYGSTQTCPPQLIAFDASGQVLHSFTIPQSVLESRSILVTPTVDVREANCKNSFVYLADCQTYSIIVVDVDNERIWQATDKTMYPYPDYGTFKIQGDQFDLMDGLLGMDLEPYRGPGHNRKMFYHAMSAPTENWVYTEDIRNQTRFLHDPSSSPEIYHTYSSRRPSQACAQAIDKHGIAYFGLMSETSINCWNTASSDYGKYIETIVRDPVTMQFASGIKVINDRNGEQELWVLTSRFQKIATGTLKTTEQNFRITAGKIEPLIFGTSCRYPGGTGTHQSGGGYGFSNGNKGYYEGLNFY